VDKVRKDTMTEEVMALAEDAVRHGAEIEVLRYGAASARSG
jgi:hypothetical protein